MVYSLNEVQLVAKHGIKT